MFGEVALIHGIPRTATITTTMPCELLMIKKEDFDIVLKDTVWKAWEEITKIMNRSVKLTIQGGKCGWYLLASINK